MFRFTIRDVLWLTLIALTTVTAPERESLFAADASGRLFPFRDTAGWGYLDRDGRVVVTPQFRSARDFSDGLGRVQLASGSTSFVDTNGRIAIELGNQFPIIGDFSEGRARFSINGKWGFIDQSGKIVIEARFDDAQPFSEGLAAVNLGAELKSEFPRDYRDGGQWGFIDRNGRVVIPIQFQDVEFHGFRDGLAQVHGKNAFTYINKEGETVFVLEYKSNDPKRWIGSASHFSDGLARVDTSGYPGFTGFVDKTGRFVIEPRLIAGEFSEGLCPFTVNGKRGYINRCACVVVQPQFELASAFDEGLAIVGKEEQLSYIDKSGRVIIPGPYNDAEPFRGGLARVHVGGTFVITNDGPAYWTGGAWHYINRKGQTVHLCRSDDSPGAVSYGRELR